MYQMYTNLVYNLYLIQYNHVQNHLGILVKFFKIIL
jgi:hypothetical protein